MTCPCHSGKTYAECCEPFHQGAPAPTAEKLMRSRYAAFALELVEYLEKTQLQTFEGPLPPNRKYTSLQIIEATRDEVLFVAGIEDRGRDDSFAELSKFVKVKGEWRYANGVAKPTNLLPLVLTRELFTS